MEPETDAKAKIVYLPLDERPCNYEFPYLLAQGTDAAVVRPDLSLMGRKKKPGRTEELSEWLEKECSDAYGAIVSIDTMLYGGIVPSRLHHRSAADNEASLQTLRRLKKQNPRLKLYALHLIMRCPQYSSADEEPDYYADWGRELFRAGYIGHREELGIAAPDELRELATIRSRLPENVMDDYLGRRAVNAEANKAALELVEDGTIDFLVIPQDDAAPYGWTAKDQQKVRARIAELNVELKALMYPGADEAGCTLLARMLNEMNERQPLVYPRFSSVQGPYVTPLYEDRIFGESLKSHTMAAGGLTAHSASDADVVLLVNTPGETMMEANSQQHPFVGYQVMRNIAELAEYGHYALKRLGKPVALADVAYANGGDLQLLKLLRQKGMLFDLAGYAGWNTSSNTLGTVIAQMMIYAIYGKTSAHLDFLALRYTEDCGYCSAVRRKLADGPVKELGYDYFRIDGQRGQVAGMVKKSLERFVAEYVNGCGVEVRITDCHMPWSRMFETGLSVRAVWTESAGTEGTGASLADEDEAGG